MAFWVRRVLAIGLMALAVLAAGERNSVAQTLTIGEGGAITSLDPHFLNAAPNNALAMHLFDSLVALDAQAHLKPGLAVSWKALSDTEWEFKLRPGVKWHDGQPFTADDVAFTIQRVPNVPNSPTNFAASVRAIAAVEVVDPLTVRFRTAQPYPLLPTDLAAISIVSRHVGQNATTEDYNTGKATVGTGPYKLVSYVPGNRIELARNDDYWGGPQPWAKVSYRVITDAASRVAALLAGDVDVIDQVPTADKAKLKTTPNIKLAEIQSLRMMFVVPDRSHTANPVFVADAAGKPLAQNPFNDLRVRQALSLAINRDALVSRIWEGSASATMQWLPPGTFGYIDDLKPPAPDIKKAKALLAEAGFPQGFRLTLHSPNDRYPNDSRTAQAVAQMWNRIGVQTEVEALPFSTFISRGSHQEFGMYLIAWGSTTAEASYALANLVATANPKARLGAANFGRYTNPELDALLAKAQATIDDDARRALLQQAVKLAIDDVAVIPLLQLTNCWASRPGFTANPRMDERTLAMEVRKE